MRRTARALSVVALVGVVGGTAAPALAADPAAEVSPGTVQPGGNVTVSVSCEPTGGPPPDTVEATSQGFDEGTVELQRVPGNDDQASGTAYRGTARISGDGSTGNTGSTGDGGSGDSGGNGGSGGSTDGGASDGVGRDPAWTVDGTCPAPPGGQGRPWSTTFTVDHGTAQPCQEPQSAPCGGAVIQRGVRAGEGGTFTDSVPALVAGGVLIAGALGGAAYRLRRRTPAVDGRS